MHGLVALEVFGQTSFIGERRAEIFRMGMLNLLHDVHRRIPAAPSGAVVPVPVPSSALA
jgi:hypothetical protein